jgi:hypothetical protein
MNYKKVTFTESLKADGLIEKIKNPPAEFLSVILSA